MRSSGGSGLAAAVFGLVVPGLLAAMTMPGVVPGPAALAAARSSAWRVVPSPNLPGWDSLTSVSASSPRDAWAVGTVEAKPGGPPSALAEHWDGRAWRIIPVPAGSTGPSSILVAVSAHSAADAWAVGVSQTSDQAAQAPLAEHWDGHSWAAVATPAVPNGARFSGVVDLGPGDAWAVGYLPAQVAPYSHTLIEHFDGHAWHVVPSPDPGTMTNSLFQVAASGPDDIWATGERTYSPVPVLTLAEHWDGRRWQVVPTSNDPAAQFNYVQSLAARSATDAWAAVTTAGNSYGNFFAHWNGKTWQKVPGLGLHLNFDLTGLVIASPSQAWAAGPFPNHGTLIARWDGTHWRRVVTPDPTNWANVLNGITAVPGSNELFAVGYRQNKGSLGQTLVLASRLP